MNKIKELRTSKGYSQKELADILFVNQTAVSQWERGITTPNKNTLFSMCELFNCSTDYILGRTDTPNEKTPVSENEDGCSEIYKIIESLSPDNRAKLLELARLFLDAQHKSEEKK